MPKAAKSIVRVILTVFLVGLLVSCGTNSGPGPNRQLVKKAIALQLSQTQQQLTQKLHLAQPPKVEINQVKVAKTEPFELQNFTTFHVRGTYDLIMELGDREVTQRQNPFDVYLQRQSEGQTWRLVKQLPDGIWYSYLLQ